MNAAEATTASSFVVLQVGGSRFALPSDAVVELAPPVRLHKFPHTTPLLAGVILRRGRIVPVYDAAAVLIGRSSLAQRFYLIARRSADSTSDFAAIPVNGECELVTGEVLASKPDRPGWITGTLAIGDESVEVLDFGALAASANADSRQGRSSERPS